MPYDSSMFDGGQAMDVDAGGGLGAGGGSGGAPSQYNGSHTPPSFYDRSSPDAKKRSRFHSPMVHNAYMASPQLPERRLQVHALYSPRVSCRRLHGDPSSSLQGGGDRRLSSTTQPQEEADRESRLNNSTSSIFASSTISNPDADQIILCMSAVLKIQMDHDSDTPPAGRVAFSLFEVHDEGQYGAVPGMGSGDTIDDIYSFVHRVYTMARFSPECCIISLVYINRIISCAQLPLHPSNWRPLVLASLILAQKVWDDKCLATSTFAKIVPCYTKSQIHAFERRFLELLQYQAVVTHSLYARYYFELRDLFEHLMKQRSMDAASGGADSGAGAVAAAPGGAFPLQPLSLWRAKQLELYSDSFHLQPGGGHNDITSTPAQTFEDVTYTPRGRYVHS
ncbi:hypothetical protein JKP88DRAFT_204293 [Tribonema minus]|uniref:Cyclin N-terminal domain-containing protein n=1 Tax=Tribonema minus TaxID=303371 RepID=A0A835ZPF7_9STRA|nr:hypothetical protein JKP88DRAFT_204293 [Tribonema minus]